MFHVQDLCDSCDDCKVLGVLGLICETNKTALPMSATELVCLLSDFFLLF